MPKIHVTCDIISKKDLPKDVPTEIWHTYYGTTDDDLLPPTLDEYIEARSENLRPHLQAIANAIVENKIIGMKGRKGKYVFFRTTVEETDEIRYHNFSPRAWGEFMQAIVGKREGYTAYYDE